MRRRTRPEYTYEQLKQLYSTPHDSSQWPDHRARADWTISLGATVAPMFGQVRTIADLSCGNAQIPLGIADKLNVPRHNVILGDFAACEDYDLYGPLETAIKKIPKVDLFVLSETLEHLDQPDIVLRMIRRQCDILLLTTPLNEQYDNPEHYWVWDDAGIRQMLTESTFVPRFYSSAMFQQYLNLGDYGYQLWVAN